MSRVNESATISIISDDPEVKVLQGIVLGLHHFSERHLQLRHFKIILATYLCHKVFNGTWPTKGQVALLCRVPEENLEPEFSEVVTLKYLHEVVPTYGSEPYRYKLGSMGGNLFRHMLREKAYETGEQRQQAARAEARGRKRAKGDAESKRDSQAQP